MAPVGRYRRKPCRKCSKYTKVYLTCFQCDSTYHAKCLLKVPGFQMNQKGHAFCCGNITSKGDPAEDVLASQEKLVTVKHEVEYDFDEDLKNNLSEEKESKWNMFKCDAYCLEFMNKEHQENHCRESPDEQGGLTQEINKNNASTICVFCNEENFLTESYEQHIEQCKNNYSRLNKVDGICATTIETSLTYKLLTNHDDQEKKHKCTVCNYSTHVKECLVKHMCIHKDKRQFKCDVCGYAAKHLRALKYHFESTHYDGKKRYNCADCTFSTHSKCTFGRHLRIHTNERPFKCDWCDYAATQGGTLKIHIVAKHSNAEKNYKCSNCQYSTYTKASLVNHMRIHTNEKPFKCDRCDYAAALSKTLKVHMLASHSNPEKKHKCSDCVYSSYTKADLVKHVRTHTKERPFKCDTCNYAAAARSTLNSHILAKHSNAEKKYKCNDCKYSAYTKASVVTHMRIHTDDKQFKCDMCDYAASRKSNLNTHILKHSEAEKTYKCIDCKYSTYRKQYLVDHLRTHTNERPFKCDVCDYTSAQRGNLNSHILAKHST